MRAENHRLTLELAAVLTLFAALFALGVLTGLAMR